MQQQQQEAAAYGGNTANPGYPGSNPPGYMTTPGGNPMYSYNQPQQHPSQQHYQQGMYNAPQQPMYSTPNMQPPQQSYYGQQQQPYYNNNNNHQQQQLQQQAVYGQQPPAMYGQTYQGGPYPPQQQQQQYAPPQPQYPPPPVPPQQQPQYAPQQAPYAPVPPQQQPAQYAQPQRRGRMTRPPYVDPITNIVYETEPSDYEGYLTKQSVWLKVRHRLSSYRFTSFEFLIKTLLLFLSGMAPPILYSQRIQTVLWEKRIVGSPRNVGFGVGYHGQKRRFEIQETSQYGDIDSGDVLSVVRRYRKREG
jgi:hypothetical protein